MVQASCLAATGQPEFTSFDVQEALTAPGADPERNSWLALDPAGAIAGWTYLEASDGGPEDFVEVYASPGTGEPALAPLLHRSLHRIGERAVEFGHDRMSVRAGAVPSERPWIAVLENAGFAFVQRHARMRRSLADVPAEPPAPPAGVSIRAVDPADEDDLRLVHSILETAFRDAPDHQPATYQRWRAEIAALPSVAWDEWFVAEVDGVPAGALQSADQAVEQGEGWVKRLAVLREHRRRGVGAALLRRAFAAYAGKGRTYAGLGVDLSNPTEAARLYRSVGMTAEMEADIYARTVEPAR
ncbi:GNAT family N-acetyltransferase [Plantactinospora sp. KBS50]|uniref:GNAT family N-acetyltransferase n=1 Tax=Plantactinospora sp. KBS50 TaxID=2024580 RepID=UPI001E32051A|nr:GNAT family N-acetyltransferase [Plantactinospora sp. KBS50]